uniref:Uncharacterized protein n=1 Tax=Panagrolaimus davidi TaxID=227884 RepID=A0A914QJT5_9BILA
MRVLFVLALASVLIASVFGNLHRGARYTDPNYHIGEPHMFHQRVARQAHNSNKHNSNSQAPQSHTRVQGKSIFSQTRNTNT